MVSEKDWLIALPNPVKDELMVYLKAPETGEASLKLLDVKGSTLEVINIQTVQNGIQNVRFRTIRKLPKGVYFLQYLSSNQKKVVRIVKG